MDLSLVKDCMITLETVDQLATLRNDELEQRMRLFESILASMGALHTSPVA
jgi:hypothetical protein